MTLLILVEIHKAFFFFFFYFKPHKNPSPDGFHPIFFQKFWGSQKTILLWIFSIFSTQHMPKGANDTFICLIPKFLTLITYNNIGLLIYVTPFTSWWLRSSLIVLGPIYPRLSLQGSFLLGRMCVDHVIVVQEALYTHLGICLEKLEVLYEIDLEKTYDKPKWDFIRNMLFFFKFASLLIQLIMNYVCSSRMAVLINGEPSFFFSLSRGIRQGDPLFPYLFMCIEFLPILIEKEVRKKNGKPAKLVNLSPPSLIVFLQTILFFLGWGTRLRLMLSSICWISFVTCLAKPSIYPNPNSMFQRTCWFISLHSSKSTHR